MKYSIQRPPMMKDMETAKYNPNVIISILILLVVYIAYMLASVIAMFIYFIIYFAQNPGIIRGSFSEIMQNVMQMATSQDATLFSLYLMAVFILLILIEVRFIEKRPLSTLGLSKKRFAINYIIGFGIGALILAVNLLPDAVFRWTGVSFSGLSPAVALFFIAFVIQSAGEEIMFRGYLMTLFGRRIGMFWAVMLSSLLFALFHIFNGDMTVLSTVNIFAVGVFLGFYVIRTNNLWGPCGIHAAWNYLQGCVYPMNIGPISLDYSVLSIGGVDAVSPDYGIVGDPASLISIAIFAAAIVWVLLLGKNKIITRKEESPITETP